MINLELLSTALRIRESLEHLRQYLNSTRETSKIVARNQRGHTSETGYAKQPRLLQKGLIAQVRMARGGRGGRGYTGFPEATSLTSAITPSYLPLLEERNLSSSGLRHQLSGNFFERSSPPPPRENETKRRNQCLVRNDRRLT